eukprot:COSAG01_NODE_61154_length_291_cov_0.421875_1_plen_68_part_01
MGRAATDQRVGDGVAGAGGGMDTPWRPPIEPLCMPLAINIGTAAQSPRLHGAQVVVCFEALAALAPVL